MRKPLIALATAATFSLTALASGAAFAGPTATGEVVGTKASVSDKANDAKNANVDLTKVAYVSDNKANTLTATFTVRDLTSTDGVYTLVAGKGKFTYKISNAKNGVAVSAHKAGDKYSTSLVDLNNEAVFDLEANTVTIEVKQATMPTKGVIHAKGFAKEGKAKDVTRVGKAVSFNLM